MVPDSPGEVVEPCPLEAGARQSLRNSHHAFRSSTMLSSSEALASVAARGRAISELRNIDARSRASSLASGLGLEEFELRSPTNASPSPRSPLSAAGLVPGGHGADEIVVESPLSPRSPKYQTAFM